MKKHSHIDHERKIVRVHFNETDELPSLLKNIDLQEYTVAVTCDDSYWSNLRKDPNWFQMDLSVFADYPAISHFYLTNC